MSEPRGAIGRRTGVWLEALLFVALALAVRLPHLDHPGVYDEYYHVLAANSLLEHGSLDTESFTYRRASIWTWCVAGGIALFGNTLAAARVPSVLAGALLVLATWAFGRRLGGVWAGRIAALLVCADFETIYFSQIARFYSFLALAVLGSLAALYFAVERDERRSMPVRALLLLAYAALSAVAFKLSHMSAIPIVAGLAGAVATLAPAGLRAWRRHPRFRWAVPVALVVLGLVAIAWLPDPVWLYEYYREAATYNVKQRSNHGFYLLLMGRLHPALCGLFPLAALFAFRSRPRFTTFAIVVLSIGLALHSGAGRKEARYLVWALPLFYLVLGVAAAVARPHLVRFVKEILEPLRGRRAGVAVRFVPGLAVAAILGVAIVANPAFRQTPELLATPTQDWPGRGRHYRPANWKAAAPRLAELLDERCVLVASSGVKALHHLDRLDYDLLRTLRDEHTPDHREEFVIDHRTHKATISEIGSLEEVTRRHRSGLVVVDNSHWARPGFVPQDVAMFLEIRFERVPVPVGWRMRVYVWGEPGTADGACTTPPSS